MKNDRAAASANGNLQRTPLPYASLGLLALTVAGALPSATSAHAQTAPATMPQYSTLTSTNDTIQASRLPVTYDGSVYYVDLTLALTASVSSQGLVTVAVTPSSVPSPTLTVSSFKAGTYVAPSNVNGGKSTIVVSGPSPLPNGGTAWTLSLPTGSDPNTYPNTAVWYVESIADNPLATRLSAAKITSPDYSYGVGDSVSHWYTNSLLGFEQVGNTLSISNFSSCGDHPTPIDSVTYTLQP